jgi:hypothetical protein
MPQRPDKKTLGRNDLGAATMTQARKLLSSLFYAAMIGSGAYLLTAISIHHKASAVAGTAAVFLMLLGGYLLWVDIIAPVLGIKTLEEAREAEDAARKRRELEDALRENSPNARRPRGNGMVVAQAVGAPMGGALVNAIFSRGLIVLVYWTITIITTVQVMLKSSFVVGAAALAACVLCFASVSTVVGSVLAKRQKSYRATDLIGIGTIGLVLLVAGLALMIWSGFYLRIFDVEISGLVWALVGAGVGAVVVRRQDAL